MTSYQIARKSHYLETVKLGFQAGVQDQLASAYGGINLIEISNYPEASVSPLYLDPQTQWELESRLLLVYLGSPHSSSEVHKLVIQNLEESQAFRKKLDPLRKCAEEGKFALLAGGHRGIRKRDDPEHRGAKGPSPGSGRKKGAGSDIPRPRFPDLGV